MVLDWIITIILFIVGLCLLISLHELGHFITAKIFGVYCFEYSIGFGKKIIRRKPKFAETYFCIGILPFGGYVSMYGEDDEEETKDNNKKEKVSKKDEINDIVFADENENNNFQKQNDSSLNNDDINVEHYEFDLINKINKNTYKIQQKLLKKFKGDKQKVVDYLIEKYCKNISLDFSKNFFEKEENEHLIDEYFDTYLSIEDQYLKEKTLKRFAGNKKEAFHYLKRKYDNKKPMYKKLRLDLYLNKEISLEEWFIKDSDILTTVNELNLPKYRSLESLSKPKKIIVMSAGIVVNFILGYVLYLISYSCFPNDIITSRLQISNIDEEKTSFNIAYEDLNDDLYQEYYEFIDNPAFSFLSEEEKQGNPFFYTLGTINSTNGVIVAYDIDLGTDFDGDGINDTYALVMNNTFTSLNNLSLDDQFYKITTLANNDEVKNYNLFRYIKSDNKDDAQFTLPNKNDVYFKFDTSKTYQEELAQSLNENEISKLDSNLNIEATFSFWPSVISNQTEAGYYILNKLKDTASPSDEDIFENEVIIAENTILIKNQNNEDIYLNTSMYHHTYWLGVKSFETAGDAWVEGTTTVFTVLGNLFVSGEAWNNVGGPLAILTQSAQIIQNYPFSAYIRMWGLISVNLAIFNLIPIPGLDGWQILVAVIEGVSQRKLNYKFKKWASIIGLSLVFGLILAILVMDVVRLFI